MKKSTIALVAAFAVIFSSALAITWPAAPAGESEGGKIGSILTADTTNNRIGINQATPTEALDVTGTVNATAFTGDGSGLTGISAGGNSAVYKLSYTPSTAEALGTCASGGTQIGADITGVAIPASGIIKTTIEQGDFSSTAGADLAFGLDIGGTTNLVVDFNDGADNYVPRVYLNGSQTVKFRQGTFQATSGTMTKRSDIETYFSSKAGTTQTVKFMACDNALTSRTGDIQAEAAPIVATIEVISYE